MSEEVPTFTGRYVADDVSFVVDPDGSLTYTVDEDHGTCVVRNELKGTWALAEQGDAHVIIECRYTSSSEAGIWYEQGGCTNEGTERAVNSTTRLRLSEEGGKWWVEFNAEELWHVPKVPHVPPQ